MFTEENRTARYVINTGAVGEPDAPSVPVVVASQSSQSTVSTKSAACVGLVGVAAGLMGGFVISHVVGTSGHDTIKITADHIEYSTGQAQAQVADEDDELLVSDVSELSSDESDTDEPLDDVGPTYLTGARPPNIVYLLADDIGWADISHNGGQFSTPNIDAILEQGVEFTNFYSHSLCTPSRSAFVTGRYAWRLGTQYPDVMHGMMSAHISSSENTFAEVTKANGYDNYYVGRWGVGSGSWADTPLGRGWDKYFGYLGAEAGYYNHSVTLWNTWENVYDLMDQYQPYVAGNGTYSEDLFLEKAVDFINEAQASGKPFTLTYASQTAHVPISTDNGQDAWLNPPKTYPECLDTDQSEDGIYYGRVYYCNKIKYLDEIWGKVMQELRDTGLWDNTIVFVSTDNGGISYDPLVQEAVGTTDTWGCNWPLRGVKATYLEGGIKVFAGMWGGALPPALVGTTHDGLTHMVDFAATAMYLSTSEKATEALNEERKGVNRNMKILDGVNLFALESHDLIIHNVPVRYIEDWMMTGRLDYAVTDGEWKMWSGLPEHPEIVGWYQFPGVPGTISQSNTSQFLEAGGTCNYGCLYHIATDPTESHNLRDEYPEIAEYFLDLVQSIYRGSLDDDYHPGLYYAEDFRGWNPDGILRPYLTQASVQDYKTRMTSRESTDYDYTLHPLTWSDNMTTVDVNDEDGPTWMDRSWAQGRANEPATPIYDGAYTNFDLYPTDDSTIRTPKDPSFPATYQGVPAPPTPDWSDSCECDCEAA